VAPSSSTNPESWEESSSSAMFTYAFVTGVKNGWLPEETYWAGRAQGVDRAGGLSDRGCRPARGVRRNGQEGRPAVLPGPAAGRGAMRMGRRPMLWSATALLRGSGDGDSPLLRSRIEQTVTRRVFELMGDSPHRRGE